MSAPFELDLILNFSKVKLLSKFYLPKDENLVMKNLQLN